MRQSLRRHALARRAHQAPYNGSIRRSTVSRRPQVPLAAATTPSRGTGSLSVLTNTRPVDRLRFQSILVFKHFDTDADGKLTVEQLDQYAAYSVERFGCLAEQFAPLYDSVRKAAADVPGGGVDMESFIDLVREQIRTASASRDFLRSVLSEAELGRLGWDTSLSHMEVATALAVFRLLDFNLDNYVKLEDLRKAQGIEREVVADQLEDADTNEDGFLSFKDFLTSYARERPVFLNMAVLLAHSAVFWLVLNLSMLEIPVKAVLCLGLLLKPQFITGAVIKLYQIGRTVVNRARVEIEMAGLRGRGGGVAA